MKHFTFIECVRVGQLMTRHAAEVMAYRLRYKKDRYLHQVAKEMEAGKGYIICTERELRAKYAPGVHPRAYYPDDPDRKHMWCISSAFDLTHKIQLSFTVVI